MKFLLLALCGLLLLSPAAPAASSYPALRDAREAVLQSRLESAIEQLGLSRAVRDRRLAITVVDLINPARPRMAGVNSREMFYSASLPKIAILLGAFQRLHDGQLEYSDELREDMAAMIRVSSNPAATRVLDQVGRDYLADLLMSDRYRLYDRDMGGGLWVGKPYGPEPAFRREPLQQLSHAATTFQVARFYYLLETGRLVSPQASREMKEILAHPGIRHKFVKGLYQRFPDAEIYRKSGTWRDYHSDSAIVKHDGKHYIVVALSHDPRGGEWLERLVLSVDRLMPSKPPPRAVPPRAR